MTGKDKKMAVLSLLRQNEKLSSLSELIKSLGSEFSERTVRRWLTELAQEGLVEIQGVKKGTRYRAVRVAPIPNGFSAKSFQIISYVRQPLIKRKPVSYNENWLDAYEPNITHYVPKNIKEKLEKSGARSKDREPAGTYARHIYNRLLIDLSYNSSRLEGNTYSLLETERLLLEGESATGKLDIEKVMILNHKDTIRYLVEHAEKIEVSADTICTIHYLLADGLVEAKDAGCVREEGVRIGGSTYIPFENPKILKQKLHLLCKKAALINEPYEQSFYLLTHLSYLQAFIDVNKRVARLSANIPLIKRNLVPLSFNDIGKDDYNSALIAVYELQKIEPLLDLFVFSYLRTCDTYKATVEALGFDLVRVKYRQERREILRYIIEKKLVGANMLDYIHIQAKNVVSDAERADFLEDIEEDLRGLAPQRIAGLGITLEQFNHWKSERGDGWLVS